MIQQFPSGGGTAGIDKTLDTAGSVKDIQQLRTILEKYSLVSGLTIGLIVDPPEGFLVQAGDCPVRSGFHDGLPGIIEKRLGRIQQAIAAGNTDGQDLILTCPAGIADAVLPVHSSDGSHCWIVVGGVYPDQPDLRQKRDYARSRGFDPEAYLDAVRRTKVLDESEIRTNLQFLRTLVADYIAFGRENGRGGSEQQKYREMFELVNDAVYLMDGQQYMLVNKKAEELFGVEPGGLLGKSPVDFSPEYQPCGRPSSEYAPELINRALEGERQRFEWLHTKADGTVMNTEVSLTRIRLEGKYYTLSVNRDISELKRIQRELEVSRAQYKFMYKTAFVGLFRSRLSDGKLLLLNQVTAEYLGFNSPEEALAADVKTTDYYRVADRQKLLTELQRKGYVENYIIKLHSIDGFEREIALSVKVYSEYDYVEGVAIDVTARQRLENELKQSRDLYKSLYSTAAVGLFRTMLSDGTYVKVNETGARILGYDSPEEVYKAGVKASDFYPKEEREALLRELSTRGRVDDYPLRFRFPDGTVKDIAITIKAYPEHGYLEGVVIDVTEKKRIDEELENYRQKLEQIVDERTRQVEQFRRFVENSNQGMGWVDLQGNFKYLNRKMCEILRIEKAEMMLGRNVFEMYDADTKEMLQAEFYPRLMQAGTARIVMDVTLPDGRKVPTENNMYLIRDKDGRPQYAANVLTDLTERVKAEEAIKALNQQLGEANENLSTTNEELQSTNEELQAINEELRTTNEELEIAQRRIEQFQRFVETSNQGMGWVELDGTIRYLNNTFREMLGIGEDEVIAGRSMAEFYGKEAHQHVQDNVVGTLIESGEIRLELEAVSRHGMKIPTENHLYLMRDSHGEPQYIASVVTDLTERIRAEQEVRDLNRRLQEVNDNLSAVNQELQAVNEEMHATNEELIATNEDLDATRQDLVEMNEELEQRVEERTVELRESQELFRLATTAANIGLWDFNPQTGEVYRFNDLWFTMLGYESDELPDNIETWKTLIHPDDLEQSQDLLGEYIQGSTSEYSSVFRMRAKDGTYRWILARGEIVEQDEMGQPVRMTGTHADITDLKVVEEELGRTQLELKNSYLEMVQIFDTASSGMRVIGMDGQVKYANRKLAEICGCTISELFDRDQQYLSNDCVNKLQVNDCEKMEPGKYEVREITVRRQDGEVRICETRTVPYLDYQGEVVGILEDIRDITDRKAAEEERKRHIFFLESLERIDRLMHQHDDPEKLLYSLLSTIHEMFGGDQTWLAYPCDPDAQALLIPYEILEEGYTSLSGKHELPIDHEVRKNLELILKSPEPVYEDWLNNHVLDSEATRYSQVKSLLCYPLFPRIGKPWLFGIHHCEEVRECSEHERRLFKEISSRMTDAISNMLYYRNLTASEKRFKSLVANLPGTIYRHEIVDGRYKQVFVSENVLDLVGYPASDFTESGTLSISDTIHPEDRPHVKKTMAEALEAGRPYEFEYRVVDRWGKVHWVHERGRKYVDEHEQREFIDGEVFDITDRKEWVDKLEELNRELAKANQDLYTKNEEMTAINEELTSTNEALAHSQKELKESQSQLIQSEKLAAIGELASGVAHELNQPLNHISITAQLLERMLSKEGVSEKDIIEELGVIRSSVNRAVSIIRNMRDFSRHDQDAGNSPVDVRTAVQNALAMFGAQLRTHNIDLKIEQPDWPVLILGLENNLVQVVINLVTNARDALDACTDRREKSIHVKITAENENVMLSVEDNGTGIPDAILANVFNPFFTTKEPGAGTGLGLSITHRIVENLRGTISTVSAEGRGTTMIVRIPRIRDVNPAGGTEGQADA